jgi:hypothetical protein
MSHISCFVGLAAGVALMAPTGAHAQAGVPSTSRGFQPPVKQKNLPEYQPQTPPPALPGTLNLAAPADRTQLDLPPTEALFDAINRGDLASARDALNRGADLGGHNILGMTPLDLSVDLARNDITFLLLSLRTGTGTGTGPAPVAAKAPGGKTTTAAAKPAPKVAAATSHAVPVAATRPQPVPRQYAGPANAGTSNPGTPNPQAGFLGFGGSVQ